MKERQKKEMNCSFELKREHTIDHILSVYLQQDINAGGNEMMQSTEENILELLLLDIYTYI